MEVILLIASLSIGLLVMANVLASLYVGHAAHYSRRTKLIQIALIWALPYVGATLFSHILWRERVRYQLVRQGGFHTRLSSAHAFASALGSRSLS